MHDWYLYAGLAAALAALLGQGAMRRSRQAAASNASGLAPAEDLAHVAPALQHTALWALGDGGFEHRVLRGTLPTSNGDVAVTTFDLETLRERRGEWAWLPVEPPFRIAGMISVAVCTLERDLPHVLLKHEGQGDQLEDDDRLARLRSVAKTARDSLGLARKYESELPTTLPSQRADVALPARWRAYTREPMLLAALAGAGLHAALAQAARRDLVIELLGPLVVVYPAASEPGNADAIADLAGAAVTIAAAVRGLEVAGRTPVIMPA